MTAISTHHFETTSIDRALLRAASSLDHLVAMRLERRASRSSRTRTDAIARHEQTRAAAQALGALGLPPR